VLQRRPGQRGQRGEQYRFFTIVPFSSGQHRCALLARDFTAITPVTPP
jgi:hypothetical protein